MNSGTKSITNNAFWISVACTDSSLILTDKKEFESPMFQRTYQYLHRYISGLSLDKFSYEDNTVEGNIVECLNILLRYVNQHCVYIIIIMFQRSIIYVLYKPAWGKILPKVWVLLLLSWQVYITDIDQWNILYLIYFITRLLHIMWHWANHILIHQSPECILNNGWTKTFLSIYNYHFL